MGTTMKSLLAIAALLAVIGALQPAHASGFYLPWYAEAGLWLHATPECWAVLAIVAAALVIGVVKLAKRRGSGE